MIKAWKSHIVKWTSAAVKCSMLAKKRLLLVKKEVKRDRNVKLAWTQLMIFMSNQAKENTLAVLISGFINQKQTIWNKKVDKFFNQTKTDQGHQRER